jgi:hypothetical protein
VTAVAGAINLLMQSALQAKDYFRSSFIQKPPGIQGIGEQAAGLAAPDGHRHIGDLEAQNGPGLVFRLSPVHRHNVPGRGQSPGQVLDGGLGAARAADPLSQEGDSHISRKGAKAQSRKNKVARGQWSVISDQKSKTENRKQKTENRKQKTKSRSSLGHSHNFGPGGLLEFSGLV